MWLDYISSVNGERVVGWNKVPSGGSGWLQPIGDEEFCPFCGVMLIGNDRRKPYIILSEATQESPIMTEAQVEAGDRKNMFESVRERVE